VTPNAPQPSEAEVAEMEWVVNLALMRAKPAGANSFWLPQEMGRIAVAALIDWWATHAPHSTVCGVVSMSGPNGEPLACGYWPDHDGAHSWSTLPTFTEDE